MKWRALLVATLFLVTLECILRLGGVQPGRSDASSVGEPDPTLGWRVAPGTKIAVIGSQSWTFSYTELEDSTRHVPCQGCVVTANNDIVVVGDSVMWGYGLSDEDTFAARLAARIKTSRVINAAAPGYGVLQSALRLRSLSGSKGHRVSDVILGVSDYLIDRDVADPRWTIPAALSGNDLNVHLPFLRKSSDGSIELVPAGAHFGELPLRNELAIVFLVEAVAELPSALARRWGAHELEAQAFRILAQEARALGAQVTLFDWRSDSDKMLQMLPLWRELGFRVLRCRQPLAETPQGLIPGDNHPSAAVMKGAAECVADGLSESPRLPRKG